MLLNALLKYSPGRIRVHLFRDLMLVVLFAVGTLVAVNYLLISELRKELAWLPLLLAVAFGLGLMKGSNSK